MPPHAIADASYHPHTNGSDTPLRLWLCWSQIKIAVRLRRRGRLTCCGRATILFNVFYFSKIEHPARIEHNKSSSEALPFLVWPSCSVVGEVRTSSNLVRPSCSVANKVRTNQHSRAVFCASILQCCCFKLAIAYSDIFILWSALCSMVDRVSWYVVLLMWLWLHRL